MIFSDLFKTGSRLASENASALLTSFGIVGTVSTAVLAGKASFEAAEILTEHDRDAEVKRLSDDTLVPARGKLDTVKLVGHLYVPAVATGGVTIGAIVMAHRVNSKRIAALATAYALSEGRMDEYQEKIKDKLGINKEKTARDELAQERVNRDFEEYDDEFFDRTVINDKNWSKVLCHDAYTGRFFYSSVEAINKAVNELNKEVLDSNYATLSDFYDSIGLDHVSISDDFGWNTNEMCEIDWSTCTTPDGIQPAHSFDFVNRPILRPGSNASFR